LPPEEREKMRITIPDFMKDVRRSNRWSNQNSDLPVPVVVPVSKLSAHKDKR
jgi:uncharacterized radical SAM superfamily Fe-S cluster-containing enzyme